MTTYLEELRDVIRHLHGAEATHIETVPVKETFRGETAWEGDVEVFALHGHPTASRVYAWTESADDPDRAKHHVTVLHSQPIESARQAVRAAIVQEFRSLESAS
jgi:hypothetical protein